MAENREYLTRAEENGSISIAEDVVAAIAADAVAEIEGVGSMCQNMTEQITEQFTGKKGLRGVRAASCGTLDGRAREALSGLGFSQEMMDGDVGALSGGWKMRVALARILLMRPDVMLLDEPSNHLDIESLIWLEQFLKGYEGALLMTSHDREFMNRIVGKVIEIDGGTLTAYSGNYEFYAQQRALGRQAARGVRLGQQRELDVQVPVDDAGRARCAMPGQCHRAR